MITDIQKIQRYLEARFQLSTNSSTEFAKLITTEKYDKGISFVKNNVLNTKEYILLNGICRSYLIDQKGDDVTLSFFSPNTAISPNLTRTKAGLSILNIQAITPIEVAIFPTEGLMTLMTSNREIREWANAVLQGELIKKVNKEINQISMTAKERLVAFRQIYPLLENQIPHSYIASYLGITTVSLSRLRKELMP